MDIPSKYHFNKTRSFDGPSTRGLGFIFRNSKDFQRASALRTLYVALIKSKLEYASIVFSPFYQVNVSDPKKLQRRLSKSAFFYIGWVLTGNFTSA